MFNQGEPPNGGSPFRFLASGSIPTTRFAVIEAMKMERKLIAQSSDIVERINVNAGQYCAVGTALMRLKAAVALR